MSSRGIIDVHRQVARETVEADLQRRVRDDPQGGAARVRDHAPSCAVRRAAVEQLVRGDGHRVVVDGLACHQREGLGSVVRALGAGRWRGSGERPFSAVMSAGEPTPGPRVRGVFWCARRGAHAAIWCKTRHNRAPSRAPGTCTSRQARTPDYKHPGSGRRGRPAHGRTHRGLLCPFTSRSTTSRTTGTTAASR